MTAFKDFMKDKQSFSDFLLVSDLDGTLMDRNNAVSEENKAALKEFMDLGGHFSICTGRVISSSEWLEVPVNTISILHNGGSIYDYDKKEILWTMPMPEETRALIAELEDRFPDLAWTVYAPTRHYTLHHNAWADWLTAIEGGSGPESGCRLEENSGPILKFVVPASPEEIREASAYLDQKYEKEENPGIAYNVSLPTLFEFTGTRSDKGEALKELARLTGFDLKDIIYMGDNMNDMNAMKTAGFSIAPESALPEVRRVADYISVDQDRHLMRDVLEHLKKALE